MSTYYYASLITPYVNAVLESDYIKENYGPIYRPRRKKLKGYQKNK
jgi:hypothetical protein